MHATNAEKDALAQEEREVKALSKCQDFTRNTKKPGKSYKEQLAEVLS
jgi:hypothetical protein